MVLVPIARYSGRQPGPQNADAVPTHLPSISFRNINRPGGETVMVPLVGHDEQVEGASFMPRVFCSSDDDALRKWEAGDLSVQAVDAEIGGGTFGEQQSNVLCATRTQAIRWTAATKLKLESSRCVGKCILESFVRQAGPRITCRLCLAPSCCMIYKRVLSCRAPESDPVTR